MDSTASCRWYLYPDNLLVHFDLFYQKWCSWKKVPVTQKTHQRIITARGKVKNMTESEPAGLTLDPPPGINRWNFVHVLTSCLNSMESVTPLSTCKYLWTGFDGGYLEENVERVWKRTVERYLWDVVQIFYGVGYKNTLRENLGKIYFWLGRQIHKFYHVDPQLSTTAYGRCPSPYSKSVGGVSMMETTTNGK